MPSSKAAAPPTSPRRTTRSPTKAAPPPTNSPTSARNKWVSPPGDGNHSLNPPRPRKWEECPYRRSGRMIACARRKAAKGNHGQHPEEAAEETVPEAAQGDCEESLDLHGLHGRRQRPGLLRAHRREGDEEGRLHGPRQYRRPVRPPLRPRCKALLHP